MMDWMSLLSRSRQPMGYGGPQQVPQAPPSQIGGGFMGALGGGMGQPQGQPQGAFGMLGNMVAQPRPMGGGPGGMGGAGRGGSQMLGLIRRA